MLCISYKCPALASRQDVTAQWAPSFKLWPGRTTTQPKTGPQPRRSRPQSKEKSLQNTIKYYYFYNNRTILFLVTKGAFTAVVR